MANLQFHTNVFAEPFTCTWEEAAAALETLPRMIFEPDGSWIWSGSGGVDCCADRWQVDGHLFDFAERLHRVELHGECPPEAFDDLLRCFGWPQQQLTFEQVREGVRLDETEFRRSASRVVPDPGNPASPTPAIEPKRRSIPQSAIRLPHSSSPSTISPSRRPAMD